MNAVTPAYGTATLLLIAAGVVAALPALILRFRLHTFVSLVPVSLVTALVAKIPFANVVPPCRRASAACSPPQHCWSASVP